MLVDPTTGKARVLDATHDEAWVREVGPSNNVGGGIGWLPDSRRVWFLAEHDGWMQLYSVDTKRGARRSQGGDLGPVRDPFPAAVPDGSTFYVESTEQHPGERHLYAVSVDGGARTKLTTLTGSTSGEISPDNSTFGVIYSAVLVRCATISVSFRKSRSASIPRSVEEIPRQVMDREIDVGFVKDKPVFRGLKTVMVHSDELILDRVAQEHPLAKRARVEVKDLGSEPFVVHHLCSSTEQKILRLFEAHDTRCNIAAELWSFENVKHFIQQDMGLAIVPRVTVLQELAAGTLVNIPVVGLDMPRRTLMVYRDRGYVSDAAQRFIDVVRQFNWPDWLRRAS